MCYFSGKSPLKWRKTYILPFSAVIFKKTVHLWNMKLATVKYITPNFTITCLNIRKYNLLKQNGRHKTANQHVLAF